MINGCVTVVHRVVREGCSGMIMGTQVKGGVLRRGARIPLQKVPMLLCYIINLCHYLTQFLKFLPAENLKKIFIARKNELLSVEIKCSYIMNNN